MNWNGLLAVAALVGSSVGAHADVFYTVQESTDTLCTIDTNTLVITPIGPLNAAYQFGDLAFDTSSGTMFMTNGWGGGVGAISSLYKVDLLTGNATLVGSMGVSDIFGLVYDPVTNKLYGSASTISTRFVEIDRVTGAATTIGDPLINLDGLTYVGSTGDIAGLLAGPGSLHSIDRGTGAPTLLTSGGGGVNNCGIAWGAASDKIYSIDWSGNFYSFDVAGGYVRATLASGLGAYDGLAATDGCGASVVYCTAKTNSLGCVPAIGSSGTPSASGSTPFVVSVVDVRNNKSGLMFYTVNGAQAMLPFQGGLLCVGPGGIKRTPAQSSGGNLPPANDCSGVYSLDFSAFAVGAAGGNPDPALQVVGTVVHAQAWGRDQGFPSPQNTTLSDGIEFTMCQ